MLPKPTLPNPSEPLGGGMPLWLGILCTAVLLIPIGYLIFTAARW